MTLSPHRPLFGFTNRVDPIITPATLAPIGKVLAEQAFQAGKARARSKPSTEHRKSAYVRFQDAAVSVMSLMYMSVSFRAITDAPEPVRWQAAESYLVNLEERSARLGQAIRELYLVAPPEVAVAAEQIANSLGRFTAQEDHDLESAAGEYNTALNKFAHAVRIDLRYDLPYRKHFWQFRRPRQAEEPTATVETNEG